MIGPLAFENGGCDRGRRSVIDGLREVFFDVRDSDGMWAEAGDTWQARREAEEAKNGGEELVSKITMESGSPKEYHGAKYGEPILRWLACNVNPCKKGPSAESTDSISRICGRERRLFSVGIRPSCVLANNTHSISCHHILLIISECVSAGGPSTLSRKNE